MKTAHTMEYPMPLGESVEKVLWITFTRSAGYWGDEIDPPHEPEYIVQRVEGEKMRVGWGRAYPTHHNVWDDYGVAEFIDAELESGALYDAMDDYWAGTLTVASKRPNRSPHGEQAQGAY